jgi:5-methylcytosine-specific restriction endonuclease McrA
MARMNLTREHLAQMVAMPNRCVYCLRFSFEVYRGLEIEHIRPVYRGGDNSFANLTVACRRCNRRKGTRTLTEVGFFQVPTFADPAAESILSDPEKAIERFGIRALGLRDE